MLTELLSVASADLHRSLNQQISKSRTCPICHHRWGFSFPPQNMVYVSLLPTWIVAQGSRFSCPLGICVLYTRTLTLRQPQMPPLHK